MAILVAGLLMLAAAGDPAPEVSAAAEQAGVDVVDLEGAVNTTGLEPQDYLYATGELSRPSLTAPRGVWDALAACESGERWHISGFHHGGLQFLPSTWTAYGGGVYARYAWQATREQQIVIAEKVQRAAGWNQWPTCARRIGLIR
jgi:hypothetical protein